MARGKKVVTADDRLRDGFDLLGEGGDEDLRDQSRYEVRLPLRQGSVPFGNIIDSRVCGGSARCRPAE
jgi:hypothetical protein